MISQMISQMMTRMAQKMISFFLSFSDKGTLNGFQGYIEEGGYMEERLCRDEILGCLYARHLSRNHS